MSSLSCQALALVPLHAPACGLLVTGVGRAEEPSTTEQNPWLPGCALEDLLGTQGGTGGGGGSWALRVFCFSRRNRGYRPKAVV